MAIFTNTTDYNNRNQGQAMKTLLDLLTKRFGGGNAPTASPTAPGNTSDDLIRQLIQGEMSQRQGTPKPFQVDRRDIELMPGELGRKKELENTSTRRYWAGRQMQDQGTDAATLDAKAKRGLDERQRVWDAEAVKMKNYRIGQTVAQDPELAATSRGPEGETQEEMDARLARSRARRKELGME